jgi:hypothetical protein
VRIRLMAVGSVIPDISPHELHATSPCVLYFSVGAILPTLHRLESPLPPYRRIEAQTSQVFWYTSTLYSWVLG